MAIPVVFTIWLALLAAADLRRRRLPNALTLGGAAAAIALRAVAAGGAGVAEGLAGGAICAALMLVPFFLHAAGGGDVKMLFAVGCFFGSARAVGALFWISVSGLALALAWFVRARVLRLRLDKMNRGVPFGMAIAIGACLELFLPRGVV